MAGYVDDSAFMVPYAPEVEVFPAEELAAARLIAGDQDKPEMQYVLGYMYANGEGVEKDALEGEKWYMRAAKGDYAPAQVALALIYRERQDVKLSIEWLHKAAKQKEPYAWYALGEYYESGVGVFQDKEKALKSYMLAANAGVVNAIVKLALFYHQGRGVTVDKQKALAYYEQAIAEGGEEYKQRLRPTMAEIYAQNAAQETDATKAFAWYYKAMEFGNARARQSVADAYFYGRGTEQSYDHARVLYTELAEAGDVNAMYQLANIYYGGYGVERDYTMAATWYHKAAENNHAQAAWMLGGLYQSGYGVERDQNKANMWFERSRTWSGGR